MALMIAQIVHEIQSMSEGKTMAFVRYGSRSPLPCYAVYLQLNRVPGHDHASIGYVLDAGASIIVPQLETVEQAQHVVSAAKFGSARRGTRSTPPSRLLPGIGDTAVNPTRSIWENVNDQATVIIQIESEEGVRNLNAILSAVGDQIDAVWLGTLDLRVSMGFQGFWGTEPSFLDAVNLYREISNKHKMPDSGMCLNGDWAKGINKAFVIVGADAFALLGDRAIISSAREHLPYSTKKALL